MRKKIIEILKKDSRTNLEDIAAMLAVSVDEVKRLISEMERDGIILQYSVVVNDELVDDSDAVTAFIEVKVTPERDKGFDSIARRLQKFEEVQSVFLMSGTYDFLVAVKGKSLKDVASFVSSKLSPLESVISCSTHFLLKKYKENGIVMEHEEATSSRLNLTF